MVGQETLQQMDWSFSLQSLALRRGGHVYLAYHPPCHTAQIVITITDKSGYQKLTDQDVHKLTVLTTNQHSVTTNQQSGRKN